MNTNDRAVLEICKDMNIETTATRLHAGRDFLKECVMKSETLLGDHIFKALDGPLELTEGGKDYVYFLNIIKEYQTQPSLMDDYVTLFTQGSAW